MLLVFSKLLINIYAHLLLSDCGKVSKLIDGEHAVLSEILYRRCCSRFVGFRHLCCALYMAQPALVCIAPVDGFSQTIAAGAEQRWQLYIMYTSRGTVPRNSSFKNLILTSLSSQPQYLIQPWINREIQPPFQQAGHIA